eukprot:TRINITY_DN586_c0_g1_i2.p1 TRINITY_DN586_c0_g1~~TRINITY_DN586_c0_g1_i2.p1  ORF type:complete len:312 (-),score=78.24 TRINITY_DN586_c0_g1_i2:80-931(-)
MAQRPTALCCAATRAIRANDTAALASLLAPHLRSPACAQLQLPPQELAKLIAEAARRKGRYHMLRLLCDWDVAAATAACNLPNPKSTPPLAAAIAGGNLEAAEYLLRVVKADPGVRRTWRKPESAFAAAALLDEAGAQQATMLLFEHGGRPVAADVVAREAPAFNVLLLLRLLDRRATTGDERLLMVCVALQKKDPQMLAELANWCSLPANAANCLWNRTPAQCAAWDNRRCWAHVLTMHARHEDSQLALCAAILPRLGAASPAALLSPPLLRHIFELNCECS